MTDALLNHWRRDPVRSQGSGSAPAVAGGRRFYAHGDESEQAPGLFFCRRCDLFHRGVRFPLCAAPGCVGEVCRPAPEEPKEQAWQLARSLYALAMVRADGRVVNRPADPASILSAAERARAAEYVARWIAHPAARWR